MPAPAPAPPSVCASGSQRGRSVPLSSALVAKVAGQPAAWQPGIDVICIADCSSFLYFCPADVIPTANCPPSPAIARRPTPPMAPMAPQHPPAFLSSARCSRMKRAPTSVSGCLTTVWVCFVATIHLDSTGTEYLVVRYGPIYHTQARAHAHAHAPTPAARRASMRPNDGQKARPSSTYYTTRDGPGCFCRGAAALHPQCTA